MPLHWGAWTLQCWLDFSERPKRFIYILFACSEIWEHSCRLFFLASRIIKTNPSVFGHVCRRIQAQTHDFNPMHFPPSNSSVFAKSSCNLGHSFFPTHSLKSNIYIFHPQAAFWPYGRKETNVCIFLPYSQKETADLEMGNWQHLKISLPYPHSGLLLESVVWPWAEQHYIKPEKCMRVHGIQVFRTMCRFESNSELYVEVTVMATFLSCTII